MYNSRSPSYISSPIAPKRQSSKSPIEESQGKWMSGNQKKVTGFEAGKNDRGVEELALWKSRCNDLESSLCQANTDLELANFRTKRAQDSAGKVDDFVRINEALASENEALQRLANQRKAESDIWRQKYESQMNNVVSLKSGYDQETKRLIQENSRLKDELKQAAIDQVKNSEDTKSQVTTESHEKANAQIKAHASNIQLYEDQLRKLRDILEQREREIQKLSSQVSRVRCDGSAEAGRIAEDREKLRMQVAAIELESAQELEKLKAKLDGQQSQHLDALKRLHDGELEVLSGEAFKLRGLLDVKSKEIEALLDQNQGLKENFEVETRDLRLEIANLRARIAENNEFANAEIASLQDQLHNQHTTDLQGLKFHHENQLDALTAQQQDLAVSLESRQNEIAALQREKQIVRDNLNTEILRLNSDLQLWKERYDRLEQLKDKEAKDAQIKYDTLNIQQNEFAAAQRSQNRFLQEEIENFKQLLSAKSAEIDSTRAQHLQVREALQQDLKVAQEEITDLKQKLQYLQHIHDIALEDAKLQQSVLENKLTETKKKLEGTIQHLEQDIQRLKDIADVKEKEIQNLIKHKEIQEREIKRLTATTDSQQDHITRLENLKAQELEDLRSKLEASNNSVIESIQQSHQNQVEILNQEINDIKRLWELKEAECAELVDKYERLEGAIGEFKVNSEKLKEHQQQIQAIGSEIIQNKSIYDSYQKNRQVRYPSSASKSIVS